MVLATRRQMAVVEHPTYAVIKRIHVPEVSFLHLNFNHFSCFEAIQMIDSQPMLTLRTKVNFHTQLKLYFEDILSRKKLCCMNSSTNRSGYS